MILLWVLFLDHVYLVCSVLYILFILTLRSVFIVFWWLGESLRFPLCTFEHLITVYFRLSLQAYDYLHIRSKEFPWGMFLCAVVNFYLVLSSIIFFLCHNILLVFCCLAFFFGLCSIAGVSGKPLFNKQAFLP